MASQQPKESVYQNDDFVSASIKADPRVKEYSVTFSDNGFILHADGRIVWECNVYDTIIPEKCKLLVYTRVELKLMKKKSKIYWYTLRNEKTLNSSVKVTRSSKHFVKPNPNYKQELSEIGSHSHKTTDAAKNEGGTSVKEKVQLFSQDSSNPTKYSSSNQPTHGSNNQTTGSRANYTPNPTTVASGGDPLRSDAQGMSSISVVKDPSIEFTPSEIKTPDYIIVEFHCLLSSMQWGYESSSAVFIRFSAPQLGNFKSCHGPMKLVNRSDDDLLEFCYAMKVPLRVLKDINVVNQKYKYHVESPWTQSGVISSLEFITGINAKGALIDRHLKLHVHLDLIENQSTVKHYDGVIWPEVKDKHFTIDPNVGLATRAKNYFFSKFTNQASQQGLIDIKSLSQSDHAVLRKRALIVYLNSLHYVLYGPESVNDPINVIRTVHAMYLSLHNSYVTYRDHGHQYGFEWHLKETTDAMYEFLTSTAALLVKAIIAQPESSFLVKVLVLLMIFYECEMIARFSSSKTHSSTISNLLKNLAIKDECTCEVVAADFVIHYAKPIEEILEKLIGSAVKCNPSITEWIFAVPLLHFVGKNCKPYERIEGLSWDNSILTKFQWGDFQGILRTIPQNLTGAHFGELQDLFLIDPYLLRFFLFKIGISYLSSMFEKVPASLLIMRLASDCLPVIKPHVKKLLPVLLASVSKQSDSVLSEEDIAIIKASFCFLNAIKRISTERDEDFFVNAIKLVLCALSRKSFSIDVIKKVTGNLENFLNHISHQLFQSREFSINKKPMQQEIQAISCVWRISTLSILNLLSLILHSDNRYLRYWNRIIQMECSQSVALLWKNVITNVIVTRLPVSKLTQLASILIEMDVAKTPAVLTDCVFDHLLKSTENTAQQNYELKNLIKELLKLTHVSHGLLSIVNASLMKIYPTFAHSKQITIDDLVQWDLWPKVLSVYVKGCSMMLADIHKKSEIVHSALIVILQLCKNIPNAKICMYDLEKCFKNVEQLEALCNAANSGSGLLCPKFKHVKSAMDLCSEKFVSVEKFSKMIGVVVKYCNKISEDITKSICDELNCDLRSKEISSLCVDVGDNSVKCIYFSVDKLPHEMIKYFIVLEKSKLFESIWDNICSKLDKTSITTFSDIHEHVWNPTILRCKELLYKFYNKSFTYSDIDIKCFVEMKSINNHVINTHVTILNNVMHQCYCSLVSSLPDPKQWVPKAVENLAMYLDFGRYLMQANSNTFQVNAVHLCLKMKELLKLRGDFSAVIHLNIQIDASCDQSSFANVGIDKVEQWLELRNVYGDPVFQRFHGVLSDSMMLIDWLREETHDCNHLNCFVEVTKCIVKNHAEATLLSNLYEIGVKLAALIYDTPENTGYVEFHSKCKLVLSTLKQYSYLTNIMEKCCNNIDLFKALKCKIGRFDFSKTDAVLYSPPEISDVEYVIIDFYCLLSIERWDFDESSKVYLRFNASELGTFYSCHGPMIAIQRDDKEYLEFHYPVKIPVRLLKSDNAEVHKYKYHVESSATESGLLKSLEFIVGPRTAGGIIDRFLAVHCEHNRLKVGSIYHRFDGIILPEHIEEIKQKSTSSWFSKEDPLMCNGVKLSSFNYYTRELKPDNHKELRKNSLLMHLQNVHDVLIGDVSMSDPVSCMEVVCATYFSLHKYYLSYKRLYGLACHDWEFYETTKEMESWLILATHSLANNIQSHKPTESYLQNILCLLVIYFKTNMLQDFCQKAEHNAVIEILLRNLAVNSSSVLETMVKDLPINARQLFLKSLLSFVNSIINSHSILTEWIFAIPIIHLLMGQHNSLNSVEWNEDPSKFKYEWGDDWESVDKKKLQWKPHEKLHSYIKELEPLFKFDPLLLRLFVKITALEDLQLLIGKISTPVILMRLAEECTNVYKEIVKKTVDLMIDALVCSEWTTLKSEEDLATIKTSLYFLKKISQKLFKTKSYENLVQPAIRLILVATSRVCSSSEIVEIELTEVKENVTNSLMDTLAKITTTKLARSIFNIQHKTQGKVEIQYWSEMFGLKCPDDVNELWHDVCKAIMITRFPGISKSSEIMAVFDNVDFSQAHEMVVCCILNYLSEGMQFGQKDLDDSGVLTGLHGLVENPKVAEKVISFLNKVLDNEYSTSKSVQMQDLLTWNLWPDIIKIFVKGCVILQNKELLEVDDIKNISEIVHSALLRLNKLSVDINQCTITGKEAESFKEQITKLQILYENANTGITPLVPQFADISDALKACVQKLEGVKVYRSKLNVVMDYCKCVSKDLVQVICERIRDNSNDKLNSKLICDVCKTEDNGSYKCFASSEVDKEMVDNFIVCGKYNNNGAVNEVFQYCWDHQVELSAIRNIQDISFDVIFCKAWKPAISQCQSLLCSFKGKTVTLEEVEKLYPLDKFSLQLSALCTAMHHCYPESAQLFPPPQEWVPHTVAHIGLYFEIVNNPKCTDAANVILKVQASLKLGGDFKIIEDLAKHMGAEFKKKSLDEVNEQLINKWSKITNMYSGGMLNKCLEVFSSNTTLVFWLKEATNGVSQLASFIEVCSSTAGEEEFNMNRLSYLHSVGSNFASLIYELPNDADFDKLDEKCKTVVNLLTHNPKLAESLSTCSEHLDWFKELKETQGSFEVTAISKVRDINQWGEYKIVSTEETPLLLIGDAIRLKIHRLNAVKKEYSLDDLRDLESKLVLITGKYAAGKVEIDKFLNYLHLVCRIAKALLALQNAGHAQYITWSYSLHCEFDVYSALENQAMKMENELKQWNKEIAKSRDTFHVLNLFTTQQLRVIRQQLGQLNCERISALPPEVISMLMSLSPQIQEKAIKECLVKSKSSLVGQQPSLKKSVDLNDLSTLADHSDNAQTGQFNPDDEVSIEAAIEKLVLRLIEQLSDVEKAAYEDLKGVYPDEVAYLSIKNCSNANIQQEGLTEKASEWWLENKHSYEDKDPLVLFNEIQALNSQNNESDENEQNVDNESNASPVVESIQEDSINLMEQMLIENDIPSGLAREAAECYPDDIEEALSYCLIEKNKSTEQSFLLSSHGSRKNPYVEHYDKVKVNEYMDLDRLAKVLNELTEMFPGQLKMPRKFSDSYFNLGEPNLILVSSSKVLKTALSLYCEQNQPFPSMDEVVICTSETTTEDIVLLWKRAIWDPEYKQIFCLLFAEKLSYKVCDESLAELDKLGQGKNEYRIVIICSSESEETSHVVSKLLQYKRDYTIFQKDKELAEYLKDHFKADDSQSAATIDPEKLSVRVVSSDKPGMGKSLHIQKLADKLKDQKSYCIVPVHGPVVDFNTVMKLLQPYTPSYEALTPQIIHMDIDSEVLSVIDTVLFSLLILKSLKDKNGNVWRLLSSQLYMIEVTYCQHNVNAQQESTLSLLQLIPSIKCAGPDGPLKADEGENIAIDKHEFKNEVFQCVFQYLRRFDSRVNLSSFTYKEPSVEGNYSVCISAIKKHCKIPHPSWAELAQFVRFLYVQLNDCQNSIYCNEEFFGKGTDFKTFIVEFMIRMSQDFAMRSLKTLEDGDVGKDVIDKYKIKEGRKWDESQHPYIFFNQDGMTMTFVGFNVNEKGQCSDFKSKKDIEGCKVPISVCECLATQGVNLQLEDCNKWTKEDMIERLCRVFGVDYAEDPDDSYVLTSDNFLKMMAIHMRFRCDIPVVIMGETGCGKTRLIRYMCDLQTCDTSVNNLLMLKVHGGTSEEDISKAVVDTEDLARHNQKTNPKLYTILFFDEANTTENIGLIKEVMCDRRLKGRKISDNVKFIAACNPYRKHTDEMIEKLKKAGLGYYVKDDNTLQKFGNIPLRHLVYRVLDLPLSMQPLLYDFGQVTGKTEEEYVHQIVTNHVHKNKKISCHPNASGLINAVTKLLAASQLFMRKQQDECSFVSLRDVERAMIVFEWFYENNGFFEKLMKQMTVYEETSREARTIILTLAVCYHARIQERKQFEKDICSKFEPPISQSPISREKFVKEISSFQDMILSQMDSNIPKNIARNVALKENVFMMLVCIELKIPLFVIGKPGSSKSLAKSIIENSMQGPSSSNELCKSLKQVKLFSYQCSQHSTPATIVEVFNNAKRFQESKDSKQLLLVEKKNAKQFVSVVVLDEVGLAEDSPSLPLKALHPLLEDGTSGADAKVQHIAREDRVAFIGISNWALDPAKMNRGVMITRGSPDEKELEQSARGICSNEKNDTVRDKLELLFGPLSKAYMEICQQQRREFFGLRDFYSLIKMLYWMVSKTNSPLTEKQLDHAILRNFDGLDKFDAIDIFHSHIYPDIKKESKAIYPEFEIIKASLDAKDISWHGESRYLLFMTENFAALRVLLQHLLCDEEEPPFVLFGSSFPKDMEYTQVCRNINQIKICMETGRTVILLNLENLYESLYDVLNQYYTKLREHRYVDLGLQSHRIKCRVDDKFKMILIAEKDTVYNEFPTPLINRLEKHFVVTSTILTESQKEIVDKLKKWAEDFTTVAKLDSLTKLKVGDAFVGYQEDTPAAVVFQAYHHLKVAKQQEVENTKSENQEDKIFIKGKNLLLDIASPDAIVRLQYSKLASEFDAVFDMYFNKQSHSSLVQLLNSKLPKSLLDGSTTESIDESINLSPPTHKEMLLLQVTTHSHLLSEPDVAQLCDALKLKRKNIAHFLLQEFDTEMDFCNKLQLVMAQEVVGHKILIIQCDCGHLHSNLIACARHKVIDEVVVPQSSSKGNKTETTTQESKENKAEGNTQALNESDSNNGCKSVCKSTVHVVFIIQLPRKAGGTSFVGFQGGDWLSVHLDDLRPLRENELSFQSAIQCSIGEIFSTMYQTVTCAASERKLELEQEAEPSALEEECEQSEHFQSQSLSLSISQGICVTSNKFQSIAFNANRRLRDLIQMACSLLYDTELNRERRERTTKRISILTDLIPTESTKDKSSFDCRLVQFVTAVLQEMDKKNTKAKQWAFEEALKHSQISGTFRNALSRRLDKILLPILAKIIALIDKNFNLTIIHDNRDSKRILSPIAKLWLEIFSERKLCKISYKEIFTTTDVTEAKKWVPRIGASVSDHFYKCQFPFSWICREVINIQKRDSAVLAERYNVSHVKKMTELLESTPLVTILNSCVTNDDNEVHNKLCCFYLNDYILSAYRPSMIDEQELVYDAVYSRFTQLSKDSSRFVEKLVVLHLAYAELEPQLQQFQQLVSLSPKIVSSVFKKLNEDSDFKNEVSDLALCAVRVLLIDLKHSKDWNKDQTKQWIQSVSYYQNSINSILNLKTLYSSTKARKDWMRILALKTFAITIGLDYNNNYTLSALRQLTTFLINPNFKSVKILKNVKLVLLDLQKNMKKFWKLNNDDDFTNKAKQNEVVEYHKFIHCCEKYFIEIITNFCFEQTYDSKDPDSDMIDFLIDCIFNKESSTKTLTPFSERGDDAAPVVRSYLLQLLMGLKADYTWEKLESYFKMSQSLAEDNDTDLHVLCIQCFEDKYYKNMEKATLAKDCLELLKEHMDEYRTVQPSTIQYFKSIATLRFCLSQFSDVLYEWYTSDEKQFSEEWLKFHQAVEELFSSPRGNYPAEYFIKCIVRQHCIQLFNHLKMCENPSFDWIIPNHLKSKEENDEYVTNPAVVYCGAEETFFNKFSETLTFSVSSKDTTELEKMIQDITNPSCSVMILMAIYANVALKQTPESHEDQDKSSSKGSMVTVAGHANFSLYPTQLPQVVADYLKQFIANSPIFNNGLKEIAKDMLHGVCRTNPNVIKMRNLQPKQLSGIIIHCVIVFSQRKDLKFLNPCMELLKNLSSMKNMYLPTMPEICEFETDLQLMGTYYVCKNGHKFLVIVDDCKNLDSEVKCTCQEIAKKDEKYKFKDERATGHILGSAASRSKDEVLEGSKDEIQTRKLKAINCSILRIFLHTILTWSSSFIDKSNPPNLDGCISPDVPIQSLERFFLRHLEKDLIALSGLLDRSIDDAVLTVHLILKWISQLSDEKFPDDIGKWSSTEDRKKWEDDFSTLIHPVTEEIDAMLRNTYNSAVKDTDTLYSKIYESTEESDPYSALWRYRTRLSLEHLSYSVKAQSHEILDEFLKQEPILRAMQYLPGVLKLQKYLFDRFHQQIGQEKALSETIGVYKKTLKDNKEMFDELVQGFNNAWLLLKHRLKSHGRLRVPSEFIDDAPKITDDTKLAYLMPTTTGEGICSSSLVDFLVCQHNEFIQFCYKHLPKTYYDPAICQKLLQNAVPLSQLQASHVLNYEHKLIPVILTHCQYSLRYGKGTEVVYDFEAIEKDLFDKFIFGKPLILLDEMPRVVLRKDAHDKNFYESIMENVKQEDLQPEKKNSLVAEIAKLNIQKLSDLLDIVEIVLGFLASAGGNPNQRFHTYITKTLTMQKAHIPKAVKDCTLSTAISLWRIVSIVHSCKLTDLGKNSFDRLDKAYCKPFEATMTNDSTVKTKADIVKAKADDTVKTKVDRLSELQQLFKMIESPIDFLMGLHNFIAVFVSHRSPDEGCNPEWSMTKTWKSAMESSFVYHKVNLKDIVIDEDILMCHTAAVWKEAVGLLWPRVYQQ